MHGQRLAFLDSAASAQKPRAVIDAISHCYEAEYANVHRGVYWLSARATQGYEGARETVARFLNARDAAEIIFTRNATAAINLVAYSLGAGYLKAGDEVVISWLEHHSNIVPWQILRDRLGIVLKVVPINDAGEFLLEEYERLLSSRTKLVAVTHTSNALGTITPITDIIRLAHAAGARVLIDGSQAAPHRQVDVQALDCDFYRLHRPQGLRSDRHRRALRQGRSAEAMPPFEGGGDMIRHRHLREDGVRGHPEPLRGRHAADRRGDRAGRRHRLCHRARDSTDRRPRTGRAGPTRPSGCPTFPACASSAPRARRRASCPSCWKARIRTTSAPFSTASGVAVRAGHHCAEPVMERFGIAGTARASFGLYNGFDESTRSSTGCGGCKEIFG